ncbi:MAG: T9SS type A sorting domain-containing protein [Crocinitomicaceae bacterium]|nr:T9SS type A sorting domain-containing protein [Crocinitomicaceae bacterium]
MKTKLIFAFFLFSISSHAQTWSDDVAQIVYDKCAKCHNADGVAPFSLTTYGETSPMAVAMYDAIALDEMPPWPPNNDYQQYAHDRSLTDTEKATMLDWILAGTPEGNPANTPPPPVFSSGALLGQGDLQVQIPVYMSKALSNGDDYVCFAMPSGLAQDRVIKAVEIIPGNREIVHHALIYVDPSGNSVTDTVGGDCGGPTSVDAKLVMGYTPGSTPLTFPDANPLKLGITMQANSQVYFAMHYPEGSYGEYDSTKVIFHFYPPGETGVREVFTDPVLQEWSMVIPPDQVSSYSTQYPSSGGLPYDISILSVFPHMHLLGQDIQAYALQPNGDTLKFIDIPHWDFHWQDFYFFKNIQKAEQGATLKADCNFDNTASNIHNPNNPPQTVHAGLNTSDEMFMVYAHYMLYFPGDETYNLDSLMNASTASILEQTQEESIFSVYPNPFRNGVKIYSSDIKVGDKLSIYVYDLQGKLVRKLAQNTTVSSSEFMLEWDGRSDNGAEVDPGLYYMSINRNGQFSNHRMVKQ